MRTMPTTLQAAHNNAAWCDVVCRAHGGLTEFAPGLWRNRRPSPPVYPNLVTLTPTAVAAQLAGVRELLAEGLPAGFGVKDSFCALDLRPLGFGVLFEAEWLGRPAGAPAQPGPPGTRIARVTTGDELVAWEAVWHGEPAHPSAPRLFPPVLLADPDVAFLALYAGQALVAGLVANRSDSAVGLSNIFLPAQDGERYRPALLAAAETTFPGLPFVGYEHGRDLAAMQALGFAGLGPLRVWARERV
jgi:hypothetical protein